MQVHLQLGTERISATLLVIPGLSCPQIRILKPLFALGSMTEVQLIPFSSFVLGFEPGPLRTQFLRSHN